MLRVHKITGAKISSLAVQNLSGVYDSGNFVWWSNIIPYWCDSETTDKIYLGGLEPDIFGENIHYPNHGLYHKWESIRHTKVDGDLYPFNVNDVRLTHRDSWAGVYTNQFTGQSAALNWYTPWNARCTFTYDLGNQYRLKGANSRIRHLLGRECWIPLGDGVVAMYAIFTNLYLVDDQLSFNQYSVQPFGRISCALSIWKFSTEGDRLYRRYDSVHRDSISNEFSKREFLASGSDVIYTAGGFLEELIELHRDSFLFGSSISEKMTSLRGYNNLVPHEPNFDAIFAEDRRNPNWRSLASSAYSNLGMSDINGIAFINDLIQMGAQVRSFANTLKTIPSSKVKGVASAWLAVHYGFKLMLLDTKTLYDTLQQQSLRNSRLSKCQATTSYYYEDVRFTARYQVFYDQFGNLANELEELIQLSDAAITSENIWDMVPFSFVIDWFVHLGDVLQSLDNYANLVQKHDVLAAGRSIKGVTSAKATQLGLPAYIDTSNITISMYLRRYERSLLPPSLVPSVTVNPFNHLIEGAALWISRK